MIVVGGVGQLYQGDFDLGRVAAERLLAEGLGHDVLVEDLHYGAVAVAQRLEDSPPDTLVLVGAAVRGRPPGAVERRRIEPFELAPAEVHKAVGEAVTGYVTIDLVVEVATGFGVLPPRTVTIEFEPVLTGPSETMSEQAIAALPRMLDLVRAEVRRAPVLRLGQELRERFNEKDYDPSPALEAFHDLLTQLETLDDEGRWARTFAERDRLRLRIAMGETSESMDKLDWGQWWALIEELDRLEQDEAVVE